MKREMFFLAMSLMFAMMLLSISTSSEIANKPKPIEPKQTVFVRDMTAHYCNGNTCTAQIGVPVAMEDGKVKKLWEMRSLKGVLDLDVQLDEKYPLKVVDYNWTCLVLEDIEVTTANVGKSIRFEILNRMGKSIYSSPIASLSPKKMNRIVCLDSMVGNTLHYGEKSTVVILQDADVENKEDTEVYSKFPDNNYGSDSYMAVGNDDRYRIYVKFNISAIPPGMTILNAILSLKESNDDTGGGINISVYHVYQSATWYEDVITWNNQPCGTSFNNNVNCNLTKSEEKVPGDIDEYVNFTVTDIVKNAYANGDVNVSFALNCSNCSLVNYVQFSTKEDVGNGPYLNITYVDAAPPYFSDYQNTSFNEDTDLRINMTVHEVNEDTCFLEWMAGNPTAVNYTMVNGSGGTPGVWGEHILSGNYSAHDLVWWRGWCNDTAGNWNASVNITHIVTNQLPSLTSISTNVSIVKQNGWVRVTSAGAGDADALDTYRLRCSTSSGGDADLCTGTAGTGERTCDFESPWSDDIAHTIYCVIDDTYANSTERNIPITADNTPPKINVIQPFNTTYSNVTITFNITGSEPLIWVVVEISGHNSTNFTNTSGQWQHFNGTLLGGTYEAVFSVTDRANITNTTSRWFTIDTTPPMVYEPDVWHDYEIYTVVLRGSNITVRTNVTDESVIKRVNITITDSGGNVKVVDKTMTARKAITNGYTYEYNYTLLYNTTLGYWTINITANDTVNNFNHTGLLFEVKSPMITKGDAIQGYAKINQTVYWRRTDTVYNPIATTYTNTLINISLAGDVVWFNFTKSDGTNYTDDITLRNYTGGYFVFLLDSIDGYDTLSFRLGYNTSNIAATISNETVGNVWYGYMNVSSNVTNVTDVYAFRNVSETNSSYIFEVWDDSDWVDQTDNESYSFRYIDSDDDGNYDMVDWYIPFLGGTERFRVYTSFIKITQNKSITNLPVTEAKLIEWVNKITVENKDVLSHSFSEKIYVPYDASGFKLDDLVKDPKFDENGRYITISGTLLGSSSQVFELTYSTPPTSTTFAQTIPDTFWVNENARISINISIYNWASDDISNVEKSIEIPYGENLYLCENTIGECNESTAVDEESIVSGSYTVDAGSIGGKQLKNYTITYEIPTAVSTEKSMYRLSEVGTGFIVHPIEVRSVAFITMQNVNMEIEDINYSNVEKVIDADGNNYTFEEGSLIVNIGALGMGDTVNLMVYEVEVATISIDLGPIIDFFMYPLYDFGFTVPVLNDQYFRIWHLLVIILAIVLIWQAIVFKTGRKTLLYRLRRPSGETIIPENWGEQWLP